MSRYNFLDRIPRPSKPSVNGETQLKVKIYGALALAILALIIGQTLLLSGVVSIFIMAYQLSVPGVLGASAAVAVGASLIGGSYLWLTNPA